MKKLLHSSFSQIPIFNNYGNLKEFLKEKFLNSENDCNIVDKIAEGSFLYSDDLLKVLGEMLEQESQPFHLIGEQQLAYEKVFELLKEDGNFSAPWNRMPEKIDYDDENAKEYSHVRWVMNAEGTEREIGCIYTAQGFDFNYIGVIFGEDLYWDGSKWSYELNKNLDKKLVSQIYGVDKKLLKYKKTHNVWLRREGTKFITLTNNRKPIL